MIHKNEANRRRLKRVKAAKRLRIAKINSLRVRYTSGGASEQDINKLRNIKGYLAKHGSLRKFSYVRDYSDYGKDNYNKPSEQRKIDSMNQAEDEYNGR